MKQMLLILGLVVVLGVIVFVFLNSGQQEQVQEPQQITPLPQTAPPPSLPAILYNLGGTVQSISVNSFVMEAKIPQIQEDFSLSHSLEPRTVMVTPQTKITRMSLVADPTTGQKRVQETTISLSALQIGDSIEVISNKEVRGNTEIQARQVRILPGG